MAEQAFIGRPAWDLLVTLDDVRLIREAFDKAGMEPGEHLEQGMQEVERVLGSLAAWRYEDNDG